MTHVDAIDQAIARWGGALEETEAALTLLKTFVGGFTDLTSTMMSTLEQLKRKHHVNCATMPKEDDPHVVADDSFCACGADFMNLHIQRMAWLVVNQWRKLKGASEVAWDHERIWTDYEFDRPALKEATS